MLWSAQQRRGPSPWAPDCLPKRHPSPVACFDDPGDCLSRSAPVRGKRGRCFGERAYRADDRREPSVLEPLSEVRQPGAVGFDDKEHGTTVLGLDGGRPGDADERATGAHQCG